MDANVVIKVENLSKVFALRQPISNEKGVLADQHYALNNVSFEIKKGESVGIIGPNGSGKSTLLKILAGVTKPTSGKAIIKGRVASILDIGAGFHPELSGRENVFLNGQILGFSRKEVQMHFDEIVSFSGIREFINEPVKNYSQGMYLRLAFSIIAHLDFDVYLFDEVLGVGDAAFQEKCREFFLHEKHKSKTIIIVNHNLYELSKLDCRILLLDKGQMDQNKEATLENYLANQLPVFESLKDNNFVIVKPTKELNYKFFEIKKISINDNKCVFLQNETIIEFSIGIKRQSSFLFLLRCFDVTGCYLFSHYMDITTMQVGNFLISFEIPYFTFNTNVYSFDLFVYNDEEHLVKIKDILYFEVRSREAQSKYEKYEKKKSLLRLKIKGSCVPMPKDV